MTALPNVEEMFDNARRCLDDAQAEHRTRMIREIAAAKTAINRARP